MQKSKLAVWGGLTNSCEKKEAKSQGEKERHKHLNAEFQRIARDKKAFFSDQCKEIEENNRMGKTRDLFNKIRDTNPGKDTGVGCRFLLQGIFLTQGWNPGLLHCRQILYRLSTREALGTLSTHHNIISKKLKNMTLVTLRKKLCLSHVF